MTNSKITKVKRVTHPVDESVVISFLCFLIKMVLVIFVSIPLTVVIVLVSPVFIILKYMLLVLRNPVSSASTLCKPLQYLNAHEAQYLYQDQKDLAVFHSILILDSSINIESIREVVTSRIVENENNEGVLLYPRFSQKIVFTSVGPAWLKQQSFDIKNHIYSGPAMSSEKDLLHYISTLLTQSLSFNIPLWEVIVIVDYGDDHDVILICRVHQCLTDGAALVKLLSHSLADNSSGGITKKPNFAGTNFGFNLLRGLFVGTLTAINWLWWSKSESNICAKTFKKNTNHSKCSLHETKLHKNKETVINISQKAGKNNSYKKRMNEKLSKNTLQWSDSIAVNDILRIKQISRTSFNDIILSALTGALRKSLQKFGQTKIRDIKVNVSVDLRKNKNLQDQCLKPRVSLVPVVVPLSCEGAVPRIWEVQKRMGIMKGSCDSVMGYGLSCLLPQSIAGCLQKRLQSRALLHFSSISVPTHPISLGGSRLKAVFAINPTASALNVTVVTYFGRVYVTVTIKRSIPRAAKLASTILRNFDNQVNIGVKNIFIL
ncbi:unnamed protein product [Meganyctiphanes norvegica]|uniref:Diacylglycerol O-acyltransferase n=1 Tax=Meganyctiphanes norvegica TaxID=48144 RepID=A0AAV2SDF3_MEGNR